MIDLPFAVPEQTRYRATLAVAAAIFVAGVVVGAVARPVHFVQAAAAVESARAATRGDAQVPTGDLAPQNNSPSGDPAQKSAPAGYPAEVVRVIDGDTFEARVRVWPGLDVSTKVRLRNVDAPELHARCADELAKAQAARAALETMLAAGGVTLSRVSLDKYGGRVDAFVATRDTADVSAALLSGGWARSYEGRRRAGWC